jgi:hypothetical protein
MKTRFAIRRLAEVDFTLSLLRFWKKDIALRIIPPVFSLRIGKEAGFFVPTNANTNIRMGTNIQMATNTTTEFFYFLIFSLII